MRRIAFAIVACLAALPARAGDSPYVLYAAGRYEDAMKAGAALGTAQGFTVAARAALADAQTRDQPCLACLRRAEGFARRAVAADPNMPDAQTYLAVSLGYEARSSIAYDDRNMGLSVTLKGDFNRAKDLLNQALKDSDELHLAYNAAYCHFGLGDVAMREKQFDVARKTIW